MMTPAMRKPTGDRFQPLALICLLGAMLMPGLSPAGLTETIPILKPSVVAVGTQRPLRSPPAEFRGTGFVVGDGRQVVTNLHVVPELPDVEDKESLAVFFRSGEHIEVRSARVVKRDPVHDLCLLQISGTPLPALRLAEGDAREGVLYAFTGYPIGMVLGLTPVTHRGIVSAVTPIVIPVNNPGQLTTKMIRRMRAPYDVYQLDATAYPGNSGSPLYEVDTGRVVGVVNSVLVKQTKESALKDPSGISYAVPGRYIRDLLRRAARE
jgi:serine protease Do